MDFLLLTFLFLSGWLVCWIQMSKSESRQVKQLLESVSHLQWKTQDWKEQYFDLQSEYLELQEQYQNREHLLESLFLEVKGKLTFPEKPELAQFESQVWQSGYFEAKHPDSTEE